MLSLVRCDRCGHYMKYFNDLIEMKCKNDNCDHLIEITNDNKKTMNNCMKGKLKKLGLWEA